MSDPAPIIFFVAGATRGLGLGFVSQIPVKYPSAIVYAWAREPSSSGADALKRVANMYPGRVEIVKYVSADEVGNAEVAKEIRTRHGKVDVVIANAAICSGLAPVHKADMNAFKEHFTVNVMGPIVLFKAFYGLLKASPSPKFIPITSVGGSLVITVSGPLQGVCYCSSKAALNWISRKIHFENEWLLCFPFAPGGVDTDMLRTTIADDITGKFADAVEKQGVPLTPDAAANKMIDIIMTATREGEGGQYVNIDSSRLPW
ncbi:NAD(P)-binding protein [Pholiota conissans]|uniref:NAD(P)-binding protein n=1 Tax=Pholiota conissans TaxID=109636 RepID=A0A9P5YNL5_9AGAR|nr:NAD(P)-binding protein [Pholiota conissans]